MLGSLDRHVPHTGPADCFADCLGIVGIVLLTLDERLDELRRYQLDGKAARTQLTRPVVRATTGFHADLTPWLQRLGQHLQPVRALQLAFPHATPGAVHSVYLKYVFCQINTNASNLHLWTPSLPVTEILRIDELLNPVWHIAMP